MSCVKSPDEYSINVESSRGLKEFQFDQVFMQAAHFTEFWEGGQASSHEDNCSWDEKVCHSRAETQAGNARWHSARGSLQAYCNL